MRKRKPDETFFKYLENLMDEHPWKTVLIKTATSAVLIVLSVIFFGLGEIICFSTTYVGFIVSFVGFICRNTASPYDPWRNPKEALHLMWIMEIIAVIYILIKCIFF